MSWFGAKVALTVAIVAGGLIVGTSIFVGQLQTRLPQVARAVVGSAAGTLKERLAGDPGPYIQRKLDSATTHFESLPEQRRQEILAQIRVVATALAPFVQEFGSALGLSCFAPAREHAPASSPKQ